MPKQIEDLMGAARRRETDASAKARLEQQLRNQQTFSQQISETRPTPPTVTLDDRMTLFRGDREIRTAVSSAAVIPEATSWSICRRNACCARAICS